MPPVGGVGGMDAIGSALASRPQGGGGQPGGPPGGQPGMPAQGNTAAGAEAQLSQITASMGKIRDIGEQVKQLGAENPQVADTAAQIQQLLKQMVVQMAPMAPAQTMSSAAVPGAGGVGM